MKKLWILLALVPGIATAQGVRHQVDDHETRISMLEATDPVPGPQGPAGPPGAQGPQGPAGEPDPTLAFAVELIEACAAQAFNFRTFNECLNPEPGDIPNPQVGELLDAHGSSYHGAIRYQYTWQGYERIYFVPVDVGNGEPALVMYAVTRQMPDGLFELNPLSDRVFYRERNCQGATFYGIQLFPDGLAPAWVDHETREIIAADPNSGTIRGGAISSRGTTGACVDSRSTFSVDAAIVFHTGVRAPTLYGRD